jgi:YidC/Oxa1 family membrane protein insertase
MQKRTILAFVLMAVVLIVSQYLFTPPAPPPDEKDARTTARPPAAESEREAPAAVPTTARGGQSAAEEGGSRAPAEDLYTAPAGETVRVETPLYELMLSTRGGLVTQIFLEKYPSFVDSLPAQLVPNGQAYLQRTIRAGERSIDLTALEFTPDRRSVNVDERPDSLVLAAPLQDGGEVRQVYTFDPETYQIDYRLHVTDITGAGELFTRLGPRLRSTEFNLEEDVRSFAAVAHVEGEVHTFKPEDVDERRAVFSRSADWVGIKSKYFLAVLISGEDPFQTVQISAVPGDSLPGLEILVTEAFVNGSSAQRLYLGPQEFRGLSKVGLEDVNQYGWSWVRWLVQPFAHLIIRILLWMHQYVPNYGVVLIIFGILVRVVMWPLTQKSFDSMQKMQAVQPELQRLRERYKNDPQRMQTEMMRIYRERGVNPLGGCLPNLIPLPVLFALFFVFQNTIEFRGAPFVGWIQDLSQPDPYYVLPILMGVTMFIQQKLTMPPDNPQMKMMLYFMPAFLTFIFLNLAAGLVLYYTVSNVLTFVQQLLMKRRASPTVTKSAPEAPPAKAASGAKAQKSSKPARRTPR